MSLPDDILDEASDFDEQTHPLRQNTDPLMRRPQEQLIRAHSQQSSRQNSGNSQTNGVSEVRLLTASARSESFSFPQTEPPHSLNSTSAFSDGGRTVQNGEVLPDFTETSEPTSPTRRRLSRSQLRPLSPGASTLQHVGTFTSLPAAPEKPIIDPDERPNPLPQRDMSMTFHFPRTHRSDETSKDRIASIAAKVVRGKANEYEYTMLEKIDKPQIRILRIEPGIDSSPIVCSLIPSALSEPYEALSYVWGNEEPTKEIKILEAKQNPNAKWKKGLLKQSSFYVRPNLYAALETFRSRKSHVDLWIDALCIDQDNDDEKEIQVAMMEDIYSQAKNVLIWLGEPELYSEEAFDCIKQMCDLSLFDSLLKDRKSSHLLDALGQLMRNVWFSRRWVVQELALAKHATLHCGSHNIHWVDFADAIAFYVMSYDRIKSLPQPPPSAHRPKLLPEVQRLGPSVLVDVTSNLFRRTDGDGIIEHRQTLEALVSSLTAYEASDPRDTIYSVLSLAKDTPRAGSTHQGHGLRPEYEKDVFEVCKDFIQSCVNRPESPSLDIICRHWAPVLRKFDKLEQADVFKKINLDDKNWLYERKLASWMPSIKEAAFGTPKDAFQGRVNGDSLVGIPPNRPTYNATPGCTLKVTFGTTLEDPKIKARRNRAKAETSPVLQRTVSDGTMTVAGAQIAVIDEMSQRCDEATIFEECLTIGKWDKDNPTEVPDTLWRTMVADRGPGGTPAPSWYKRACRHAIALRTANDDVKTSKLLAEGTDSLGVEFLKRVRDVIWNKKFFCTKEEERLGLAPKRAKSGDIVCVLYGCSVPVILRKIKKVEEYEFIGECYLHGMMDGEAVSGERKALLIEKEFVLR